MPMSAIAGVVAKETGYGFAFTIAPNPAAGLAAASAPAMPDIASALDRDLHEVTDAKDRDGVKPRPSHLQVIK